MPTPTKGRRLGGSPAHQRHILANLATALFEHRRVRTTEAKARRLRPVAERLITFAKRGDLHARRKVLTVVTDKSVVHSLFTQIGPSFADRPGGYTRITKIGPRKGDNAPMAVIELVAGDTQPTGPRRRRARRARPAGRPAAEPATAATTTEAADVAEDTEDAIDAEVVEESADADVFDDADVLGDSDVLDDGEAADTGLAAGTGAAAGDEAGHTDAAAGGTVPRERDTEAGAAAGRVADTEPEDDKHA